MLMTAIDPPCCDGILRADCGTLPEFRNIFHYTLPQVKIKPEETVVTPCSAVSGIMVASAGQSASHLID
jgi:hypothetical protein